MPINFNGTLKSNEVFASIFNMIISQQVFADNIKGVFGELVNDVKTDGSLYGDTKLFYATDILKSRKWNGYNEAGNLLATNKPADPECQAITIDQFRQIDVTLDQYLSKRAWSTEGAFGQFQSVVMDMIGETKKVYEATLINSYVGTVKTTAAKAELEVVLSDITATGEEKNRLTAQTIATAIAKLMINLQDVSRDYNEYGFLRSYTSSDFLLVWNADKYCEITKLDLPTIFHKDGLIDKLGERILPARYFGEVDTVGGTVGTTATLPTGKTRATDEMDVVVSNKTYHLFAGDAFPAGAVVTAGQAYVEDEDVICKVVHKNAIKFMGAFEVSTNFFNPRSLTTNHYLTWGYSKPDYLKNYPIVVVHAD